MLYLGTRKERRERRTRVNIKSKAFGRPRLSVFRSGRYIYAQLIDDLKQITLFSASSIEKDGRQELKSGNNMEAARWVGQKIGKRAVDAGIIDVVFDRGAYLYHGRVKALADEARKQGLNF